MGDRMSAKNLVRVNRAPVITLWAAVVAERMGFNRNEALTLGRAVCGLNAYAKGKALGLFHPSEESVAARKRKAKAGARLKVELMHRAVPVVRSAQGLRALSKGRPIEPGSVARYLEAKFAGRLNAARAAMQRLARAFPRKVIAKRAYPLYVAFRPTVPAGTRGWGAQGVLRLDRIRALAR
jgi:hypothetical protein